MFCFCLYVYLRGRKQKIVWVGIWGGSMRNWVREKCDQIYFIKKLQQNAVV